VTQGRAHGAGGAEPSGAAPEGPEPAETEPEAHWRPARGTALDWCHERLAEGARGAEDPDDRDSVQAMPVVLHVPKPDPPARTPLLEAAAGAVARFCLDERVAPGGVWHEGYAGWMDARMRKIARRARGAQWRAACAVPGISHEVAGCAARAFEPGPVDAVHPHLGRLQIGGTDLPDDEPGPPPGGVPVVWLDAALDMTVGKAAAQVGHGVMLLAAEMSRSRVERWIAEGLPLSVRSADADTWSGLCARVRAGEPGVAAVVDAGYTEVAPGSVTVVAEDRGR